jgi:hypothetical protein
MKLYDGMRTLIRANCLNANPRCKKRNEKAQGLNPVLRPNHQRNRRGARIDRRRDHWMAALIC